MSPGRILTTKELKWSCTKNRAVKRILNPAKKVKKKLSPKHTIARLAETLRLNTLRINVLKIRRIRRLNWPGKGKIIKVGSLTKFKTLFQLQ